MGEVLIFAGRVFAVVLAVATLAFLLVAINVTAEKARSKPQQKERPDTDPDQLKKWPDKMRN